MARRWMTDSDDFHADSTRLQHARVSERERLAGALEVARAYVHALRVIPQERDESRSDWQWRVYRAVS